MKQWIKIAAGLSAWMVSQVGWAGDAALYGPSAPANAGFFRVMNAGSAPVNVSFNGKTLPVSAGASSGYAYATPGQYPVTIGSASQTLTLSTGSQQTLLWLDNKVVPLNETPFRDKSKARLALYNLTGAPVSLLTSTGKAVLGPVAGSAFTGRDVNALQMAFKVADNGQKPLVSTEPLLLKRGQVTSIFVLPGSPARVYVAETMQ